MFEVVWSCNILMWRTLMMSRELFPAGGADSAGVWWDTRINSCSISVGQQSQHSQWTHHDQLCCLCSCCLRCYKVIIKDLCFNSYFTPWIIWSIDIVCCPERKKCKCHLCLKYNSFMSSVLDIVKNRSPPYLEQLDETILTWLRSPAPPSPAPVCLLATTQTPRLSVRCITGALMVTRDQASPDSVP